MKDQLLQIQTAIQAGKTTKDIADTNFDIWIKYHRAIDHYILLCSTPRTTKTKLTVIYGPTGTGKSHYCLQQDSQAYWKTRNEWWDKYSNHKTVIIDDFYGWLPFDTLLRLADKYPLQLPIKGGHVNFNAEHIYITSNKTPNEWYKEAYMPAFMRRVEQWIHKPTLEETLISTEYNF